MSAPEVRVFAQPVVYEVGVLPLSHEEADTFRITVEWCAVNRWAVCRGGRRLGADGEWGFELREDNDDWIAAHRFPLDEALRLAREAAPSVKVNGRTAAEVAAGNAR